MRGIIFNIIESYNLLIKIINTLYIIPEGFIHSATPPDFSKLNLSKAALNYVMIFLCAAEWNFTLHPGFLCTSNGSTIENGNLSL